MPPIDRLLSQYSNPVRSWPGEEDLDAEARANYAAANPPKLQTEGGSIDKGDLLPIVRYPEAKKSPSEWQSSSDVMRQLDDGWRIEPFSRLMAPFKSMAEAWRTQPVLGPMVRPSQMNPEAFNQMSSDAMTVAGTGMTGGIGRAAVGHALPAGTAELGIFGGRKAKTADLDALARAEEMARVGTPREEIWSQTGWFSGPDGKWRFEIDDSGSAYKGRIAGKGMSGSLDSMFEHPSMYDAYPEMGAIPLETARGGTGGSYSAAGPGFPERIGATSETPERMRSLILHEAQHGVQSREGFAPGANPDVGHLRADVEVAAREAYEANRNRAPDADDELLAELGIKPRDTSKPWDELTDRQKMEWWEAGRGRLYRQSAGETEARAVQARQDLTPEQRRARAPWLDYDVPEKDQIVRFGNESGAMSNKPLDMSPEARLARAREMGFDVDRPLYHGTTAKFDSFADKPAFFTEERGVAAAYARPYSGPRGEVGEYYIRPGKQANLLDPEMRAEIIDDIAGDVGASPRQIDEALRYGSIYNYLDDGAEARFFEALKSRGFDSVRMPDAHPGTGAVVESVVALNPNNIRSVDAAFDPSEFASPTLMASIDPLTAAVSPARQVDPLGYYSPTLDAALRLSQKKGTPEQMLAQLKKAGAKDSEIEVSGLKKMFEGKKSVSQEEIVKALEEGKVGLNEQVYSRGENFDGELQRRLEEWRESVREMGRFQPEGRTHRNGEFFERDENIEKILPILQEGRVPMDYDAIADDMFNAAGEFNRAGVKITQGVIPAWSDHHGNFYVVETPDGAAWMMADHDMSPVRYASKAEAIADAEDGATRNNVRDMLQEEPEVAARLRDEIEPDDPTRYSSYSLDPENPTYREVVLHLPATKNTLEQWKIRDEFGNVRATYSDEASARAQARQGQTVERAEPVTLDGGFRSGHFDEPNIVGHMMVSETRLPKAYTAPPEVQALRRQLEDMQSDLRANPVYGDARRAREAAMAEVQSKLSKAMDNVKPARVLTLDQVQSDWGQKLRDGGVRDEARIADIERQMKAARQEFSDAINALDGKISDSVVTRLRNEGSVDPFIRKKLVDLAFDHAERSVAVSAAKDAVTTLRSVGQRMDLLRAEMRTAQAATPGHPLVNTTDQWLNTTLRRAIRMASEEGQDYIAIPSGRTVLGYNPGQEKGMLGFYGGMPEEMSGVMASLKQAATKAPNEPVINVLDPKTIDALAQAGILDKKKIEGISAARVLKNAESRFQGIVPKNLYALLQKLDKNTPPPQVIDTLDSPSGKTGLGQGFTLFRITPEAKKAAKESGQPLFRFGGRVN